MGRGLAIAAIVLFVLSAAVVVAAHYPVAARYEGHASACETGEGCARTDWQMRYYLWGERVRHNQTGTADDHELENASKWTNDRLDGTPGVAGLRRAGPLAFASLVAAAVGAAAVAVALFTHRIAALLGGAAGLVAVVLAGLAILAFWSSANDRADAFQESNLEPHSEWKGDGPFWSTGLTALSAAGALALAGSILAFVARPPPRRKREEKEEKGEAGEARQG